MKAILQGEVHTSSADRKSLESQLDRDVDALFVERRADSVSPECWSLGYVVFLTGVFTIYWVQEVLRDEPDVEQLSSVPVHDEIDTTIPVLYDRFPRVWIATVGLLSLVALSLALFAPSFGPPLIEVSPATSAVYTVVVKFVILGGTPVLFSGTLIGLDLRRLGSRDRDMADNIDRIATENGYETVVVSCGERHLEQLSELLEENGWEIEVSNTNHKLRTRI
ncbi:hypothetical protein [Halobaculum sp. MBLA0143]|uniref:hypothetical protein n=1 Tax=Halobaculum sp. MBLA0143 TaxID=3079933 RepID=UPI00352583D2